MERYSRMEDIISEMEAILSHTSRIVGSSQSAPSFRSDVDDLGIPTQWSGALIPRRDPEKSYETARQMQLMDEACNAIERGIGSIHVSDLICMLDHLNDLSPRNPRLRTIATQLKRQLDWFTLLMNQGDTALDERCPEAALAFYRQANGISPNPLTGAAIELVQRLIESNARICSLQAKLSRG